MMDSMKDSLESCLISDVRKMKNPPKGKTPIVTFRLIAPLFYFIISRAMLG
jgi:hypothetical protein